MLPARTELPEPPLQAKTHEPAWALGLAHGDALVLARQPLPESVLQQAKALAHGQPLCHSAPFRAGALRQSLVEAMLAIGAGDEPCDPLIEALVPPLEDALSTLQVGNGLLRLEIVHSTTCPKWHVDRLRLRLCCTLAGDGTEYLPPGQSCGEAPPARWQQLPTGVLAGMAGSTSGAGLWHRSPHACPTHPRLFLSLDVR